MIKRELLKDREIVEGILLKDKKALQYVYDSCFPLVLKMVVKNSGNKDEADDLFQDAVVVLFENVNTGNFELKSSVSTYIYSVSWRLWLKRLKQKGKQMKVMPETSDFPDVEKEILVYEEEERRFEKLGKSIDQLGEPCKSLLQDFYINGLNMQELADKFSYTNPENAKNQKYKCLQRLRKMFFKKE